MGARDATGPAPLSPRAGSADSAGSAGSADSAGASSARASDPDGTLATGDLRALPAVHELAARLDAPHSLAVAAARQAIGEYRDALLASQPVWEEGREAPGPPGPGDPGELEAPGPAPHRHPGELKAPDPAPHRHHGELKAPDPALPRHPGDLEARAQALVAVAQAPSLRRVLNATGVILHTNLGRAPLAPAARDAVARAAHGYCNLEFDLSSGERGSRQAHVEALLGELTGATAALVVNNGAAAVLLAVAALAGRDTAVVVSRGQLVEIGGGFRIPEVVEQSGARLIEVGTTNRTRLEDYQRALASSPVPIGAILRVHPSNFRTIGFVAQPSIEDLCRLEAPVIDDAGSGLLNDSLSLSLLADEPAVARSVAAGAALVCCSGDKLLGGPQAGLLIGRPEAIAAARAHPLARAMRIDKLSLAALEATLRLHRDPTVARAQIPTLAMLTDAKDNLARRAEWLAEAIGSPAEVVGSVGRVGGGALPLTELDGPAVSLSTPALDAASLAAALRAGDPAVIGRIYDDRFILDPRTLADDEIPVAAAAVRAALPA